MATSGSPSTVGQAGEKAVGNLLGMDKNTDTYTTRGSGPNRIPDFVDSSGAFHEAKNTKRLSSTSQLNDFVRLAGDGNVTLYTRQSTVLSGPLADQIRNKSFRLVACFP